MMTKRSLPAEEAFAGELLEKFLITQGHQNICWDGGENPPDLDFLVDEQRWAVEVTRVDSRIEDRGENKSRSDVDIRLLNFGLRLKRKTDGQRRHDYLLIVPRFPEGERWNRWTRKIEKQVFEFINSGQEGSLALDTQGNAEISTIGVGDNMTVTVPQPDGRTPEGHEHFDIAANQRELLRYALDDKAPKLVHLQGFDKKALILLNFYFFGDDTVDVSVHLQELMPSYETIGLVYLVAGDTLSQVYANADLPRRLQIS